MRLLPPLFLALAASLAAAETAPAPVYPLWDGQESIADYARRVNLPPTKTLDLGGGVKMELVLIPAGKFIMGTPEPTPVDEEAFHKQIVMGQALLAASAAALLVMLSVVAIRAVRNKRRPQLSLGGLLLVTVATGGCLLSGLHWRHSVQTLGKAKAEYAAAKARHANAKFPEMPAHLVTLTKPFYMGKFVATQAQWKQMTGQNPSRFKGRENPVEMVSWIDAFEFCNKLTEQTKQLVRLPTEAQWEFACRAGTITAFYSGDKEADLARVAWYDANSKRTTHPVGQKEANTFGLYDMHGNVLQWCQDWYSSFGKSEAENPQGPEEGSTHVLRGGAWCYLPRSCRSAYRLWGDPDERSYNLSFRVVVVPTFSNPEPLH